MNTPTKRLHIEDLNTAVDEIKAFAAELVEAGERPWFEVWYPRPEHFDGDDAAWAARQAETFDAVEVVDGEIVTLPPYSEIGGA